MDHETDEGQRRRILFGVLMVVLVSVVSSYSADLTLGDPRTMTFKPVDFSPPDPDRVVLDNGMVVYLLEDHEFPLVTMNATMRTGSWLDPADKVGLAGMTGAVMRTGGVAVCRRNRSMPSWSSWPRMCSISCENQGPRLSMC